MSLGLTPAPFGCLLQMFTLRAALGTDVQQQSGDSQPVLAPKCPSGDSLPSLQLPNLSTAILGLPSLSLTAVPSPAQPPRECEEQEQNNNELEANNFPASLHLQQVPHTDSTERAKSKGTAAFRAASPAQEMKPKVTQNP